MEFVVELGPNSYPVHVGDGILPRIGELALAAGLAAGRCALITDTNVGRLYSATVLNGLERSGFHPQLIEIAPGETSKSLDTLKQVYHRLAEAELDRDGAVFALRRCGRRCGRVCRRHLFARIAIGSGANIDGRAG